MAAYLSPVGNSPEIDANGAPLVGGKIYSYVAGSSTPAALYTTSAGTVAQTNPVILNARGIPASPLWIAGGSSVKLVLRDSNDVVLQTIDDVRGINDPTAVAAQDQWVLYTAAPTYVSATSFSVVGDQTPTFQVGRRLKTTNTGGTVYSTIATSTFSAGVTTVTVTNDSSTLDAGLSSVSYGLLSATSPSIPALLLGIGQTSQNVTASRALTTVYTNSTTRPIFVHVRVVSTTAAGTSASLNIGGTGMSSTTVTASGSGSQISGVVPPGVTYSATVSGTGTLSEWVELR